jgi:hypothetical protein
LREGTEQTNKYIDWKPSKIHSNLTIGYIMPISITRLSTDEVEKEFKRAGNDVDNIRDYIVMLSELSVGEGFTMKVKEIVTDGKQSEVVPDSVDAQDKPDTVRTFKRRMNAAAKECNLGLKWKVKGHRTGDGKNARFVTDWLMVRIVASNEGDTEDAQND